MSKFQNIKKLLKANHPVPSTRPGKKRMVRAVENGKEKLVHFGDTHYGNNYSPEARKSFRARHHCDEPGSKLKPRYWACQNLWKAGGSVTASPKGIKKKG